MEASVRERKYSGWKEAVQRTLAKLGCDTIQGYLVSKPLPLAELLAFLEGRKPGRRRTKAAA